MYPMYKITSGEAVFSEWATAMKMVVQLSGGIPAEFRKRLWLTLAEKHLADGGVDWTSVEKRLFKESTHPSSSDLGVQISKDLHRTGCSLFCGEDGEENQVLLKRVLLAYARWNKNVGYCQGFNMLAALILQVTDKNESDALKLMIYLIEGVLPDSYFADNLKGLSVDMAVFRELLRNRLPRLSNHLDLIQNAANNGTVSYEPPLTNAFTMQWFLTLFCNCLPQPTVLRIWDLIMLEGNDVLLRTALAIWKMFAEQILTVRSADEFYCVMGLLTRQLLDYNMIDANSLVKAIVTIGSLNELPQLRHHYSRSLSLSQKPSNVFHSNINKQVKLYPREKLILDVNILKQQYAKLKQRQKQVQIIFNATTSRGPSNPSVAMNHLYLGKNAIIPMKQLQSTSGSTPMKSLPSPAPMKPRKPKEPSSSSSSDTELCDDATESSDDESPDQAKENILDSDLVEDSSAKLSKPEEEIISNSSINDDDIATYRNLVGVMSYSKNNGRKARVETRSEVDYRELEAEKGDDSLYFENYFKNRLNWHHDVKSVKDKVKPEEIRRTNSFRRNSERVLHIIQENSLVLHRITQF